MFQASASQRAIVTGASGFIGHALTRQLLAEGWHVTAVGRDATRLPAGAEPVVVTQYNCPDLDSALAGKKCDVVFHLAAYGVLPTERDPDQMLAVNVVGTAAMVRVAAACGAAAFVYAGSSAEYADAVSGQAIDEHHPTTASGIYGASKAAGGLYGRAVAARYGLTFQWLRIFGVFGPGEAPHRLLPTIANQLAHDRPVDLSAGEQIRDVLCIDEVVSGLLHCARAALGGEGGPINLCSGRPISVRTLATALADAMGKPRDLLRFGAIPYRPDETLWLLGDASKLERVTGFRPVMPLDEAMSRFLRDFPFAGRAKTQ
jgi:nucleoside-diphosphate-sugar epimerase